jgi:hypothetical protein
MLLLFLQHSNLYFFSTVISKHLRESCMLLLGSLLYNFHAMLNSRPDTRAETQLQTSLQT